MELNVGGWADDDENDVIDPSYLPEDYVEEKNGFKTRVSFRIQDGEKQKVMRKYKVVSKKKKVPLCIKQRREIPKFGAVKDCPPGPEEETTCESRDEVRLENPGEEAKAAKREEEDLLRRLREGRAKRAFNRQIEEKKAEISGDAPKGLRTGTALSEMAAQQGGLGGDGGAAGKYVPLHMRPGATTSRFDDSGEQNTLRVTNISEDTTEDDLRELFQPFGRIQRVYLAKDRETQISRGFAYISFMSREHAERAMEKLNGFGYDHLILKVEWAKPSTRDDSAGQSVMKTGIVSGYGGALPQG
mmetsp:Transcript_6580/g.12149  ORF Transcript_6580/g.12149 Transcript_6580/m.12149 type:complete len:301 (+) Transcript_6580:178-1080(+)